MYPVKKVRYAEVNKYALRISSQISIVPLIGV